MALDDVVDWLVRIVTAPAVALGAMGASEVKAPDLEALKAEYQRPQGPPPAPADNPTTPAKVELGRTLFFDPRLSATGVISCATCHNPGLGWEDGLGQAVGHMGAAVGRSSPTVLNLAWGGPYFWDGRAETLEDQAVAPINSTIEMNLPHGEAVNRVAAIAGYREMFARAFDGGEVNIENMAKAIAAFERTVVSDIAPFDRWISGDETAISEDAKRGFVVFNGKARCSVCHSGWRFTDDGFHDIGAPTKDPGRARVAPGLEFMNHAFKTPTLRNVDQRAPYLHNGAAATLEEVIELYDKASERRPSVSAEIQPLNLSETDRRDLVAFLQTLTSNDPQITLPVLPR